MRRCSMDAPAIRIESLSKTYAGGKVALNDVSFDVPRGQIFGLLGPNGAGKSTTIGMMVGALTPDSGSVRILDTDPADPAAAALFAPPPAIREDASHTREVSLPGCATGGAGAGEALR